MIRSTPCQQQLIDRHESGMAIGESSIPLGVSRIAVADASMQAFGPPSSLLGTVGLRFKHRSGIR